MMTNNKGSSIYTGFILIFVSLFIAIGIGLTVYTFGLTNDVLRQDIMVGQTNMREITDSTFGQIANSILTYGDIIGIILLFGQVVGLVVSGFYTRNHAPIILFVADLFILILFFVPSVYVSQVYDTFIHSSGVLSSTFINDIPKVSKFMLNLPKIVAAAGILTMILTYAFRDGNSGQMNVLGY